MLKCTPSHTWGPRSPTAPDGLTVGRHPPDPRHAGAGLDWVRVEASAGWGSCLGDRVAQVPRVGPATASSLDGVQCRSLLWHRGAEPRPLAGLLLEAHRAGRSWAAVRRQETAVSDHTPRTPLAAVGDLVLSLPGGGPAAELREAGEPAQATWPVAAPHSAGLLLPSCALGPLRPHWPRPSPLVDRTEVRAPAWRPRYDRCLPLSPGTGAAEVAGEAGEGNTAWGALGQGRSRVGANSRNRACCCFFQGSWAVPAPPP